MKLLLSLLVAFIVLCKVGSNVIGIDLASDSLKVAIVQPGTPFEIVTNFQSKRKTPVCVAFYKSERLFGSDATALMGRKPEVSFSRIFRLLGRNADHPAVKEIKDQYFPYNVYVNETTGHTSITVENEAYTAEELMAMVLQNVKDMVASFGGKGIKDCVITVPAGFTQHEKEAVYTAADIADLKVLSLIEQNTAAALQYAMDRVFEQPSNVLYYNMGSGSTEVSIVSYSSQLVKEGGKNKTVGQFEVVGKAWDYNLGGFNFDLKLTDLLAQRFNEAWGKKPSGKGKDIREHYRPMTRLRIEANKVKEVLSANNEFPIRAEQLHADVDLVTKVTRHDFEEACEDLFGRVLLPIEQALVRANLSLADINSVELLGGGVRMPKIKRLLDEHFKAHNITVGQHLNGDEAMALGAAFRGANLSTAFRVRKIGMTDISNFGVSIQLENLPVEEKKGLFGGLFGKKEAEKTEEGEWSKSTLLYPGRTSLPGKSKTVAFTHDQDISCRIQYGEVDLLPAGTSPLIAMYNISGIASFTKDHEKDIYADKEQPNLPKVHLSFGMDSSGIISLVKAEVTLEIEDEAAAPTNTTAETNVTAAETNTTAAAESTNSTSTNSTAVTVKPKKKQLKRVLTISPNPSITAPPKWTTEQIQTAKQRLRILQLADETRRAKAAAMNDLEAYIYKVKNRLSDEEDKLKSVSTDEQRQDVTDTANAAEEWLYDEGRDQEVAVYTAKQNEIKVKAEAIFKRFSEVKARADAISKVSTNLADVRKLVASWAEKMPHITETEAEDLLTLVSKVEKWIEDKLAEQEKVSPFEKPAFDSSEVLPQLKPVTVLLEKLLKKPRPAPVVPEKNTTAAENATATASEEGDNTVRVEREPAAEEKKKDKEESNGESSEEVKKDGEEL